MAGEIPVHSKGGKLPLNVEFTPFEYQALLMQRLQVFLSGDDILLGSTSDSPIVPLRNVGPWWRDQDEDTHGETWYVWSETYATYVPATLGLLSADRQSGLSLTAAPTADRTISFPDATTDGEIIATLDDAYVPRDAVILTGTNPTLNASLSSHFFIILEGNTTIAGIHLMPTGKKIRLTAINDGTSYTLTWPTSGTSNVGWTGGTEPTQAVSDETGIGSSVYDISEVDLGIPLHYWGFQLDFRLNTDDTTTTTADPPGDFVPSPGGGPFDLP